MASRGFLTVPERATLRAVCDTPAPALDPPPGTVDPAVAAHWQRSAADLGVAAAVEETFWLETTPEQQRPLCIAVWRGCRSAGVAWGPCHCYYPGWRRNMRPRLLIA